jgi:hypothetical protein
MENNTLLIKNVIKFHFAIGASVFMIWRSEWGPWMYKWIKHANLEQKSNIITNFLINTICSYVAAWAEKLIAQN